MTPLCNLDCKMCYVHLSEKQVQKSNKSILSGRQWKDIIKQAVDQGMLYALLTGGEALLHPDFDDIYLYLQSLGVHVSINTNGLLLSKERLSFFCKHRPKEIHITLYGNNEETYKKVTNHRVFSKILENIKNAKDLGLSITINVTPNKYTENGNIDLISLVQSIGVPFSINSSLSEPRKETGRDHSEHDITLDDYVKIYKYLHNTKGSNVATSCNDLPEVGGHNTTPSKGFRCGGGRSSFAILWYGVMQPCLTVQNIQVNLQNFSFTEAWQQIHNAVSTYPVPIECIGCPYERICTVCVARHAKSAPLGHANPFLCARAKRLVSEGIVTLD